MTEIETLQARLVGLEEESAYTKLDHRQAIHQMNDDLERIDDAILETQAHIDWLTNAKGTP
jgi:hypothetical protein